MQKEKIGVREIFDRYGAGYINDNKLTPQEKGLISLLSSCGTRWLGSHTTVCNSCHHTETSYNSCRNRHCPNCQQKNKLEWMDKRMEELLPVGYYHFVFTIPHELNLFCDQNKKTMYNLLFKAVSQTIMELIEDPKHAGAKTGLICVLHTWGQALTDHYHLHCLMPAGGFTNNGSRWLNFNRKDGFLVHYKVISRLFRKKFLEMFTVANKTGEIKFFGEQNKFRSAKGFTALTAKLAQKDWVVNIQRPMGNPEKILEYLSRYVFRVAISNNRIKCIENGKVHFSVKDYRTGTFGTMKLDIDEFIRRFLLHVLPDRFLKVRYYGIFANRHRKANIEKARELLKEQAEIDYEEALEDGGTVWKKQDTVWEEIKQKIKTIKSPNCPVCKKGLMKFGATIKPRMEIEPEPG